MDALLVSCSLSVAVLLTLAVYSQLRLHDLSATIDELQSRQSTTAAAVAERNSQNRLRHDQSTVPFTGEELLYLKYSELNQESVDNDSTTRDRLLIRPRDERYLQLIRSEIARPVLVRPTATDAKRRRRFLLNDPSEIDLSPVLFDGSNKRKGDKYGVSRRFHGKRNGFFVECGANDGQYQSNTMLLETRLNWTGLLVEANPTLARKLLSTKRQAFVYPGCLSPVNRPALLKFRSAGCCGGLADYITPTLDQLIKQTTKETSDSLVQCYPLGDLLAALGVYHVDYLSLDVHGAELPILKTIDFHQFRIDLLTIECYSPNVTERQRMIDDYTQFFAETGLYKTPRFLEPWDLVVERRDLA